MPTARTLPGTLKTFYTSWTINFQRISAKPADLRANTTKWSNTLKQFWEVSS